MELLANEEVFHLRRDKVLEELKIRIENTDTINHCLAVEAIMHKLAELFNEHTHLWAIAGLVHDIDYERVQGDMSLHGVMAVDILEALNFDETIIYAVRAHNPVNNVERRRKIDKALYCSSPMAHFIFKCVDSTESKKLKDLDAKFVIEQFYNTDYAPEIDRSEISTCTEIDIPVEKFIKISVEALKLISNDLGM